MKTINVKASEEIDPNIETMYACNVTYGIETTHDKRLAEWYILKTINV